MTRASLATGPEVTAAERRVAIYCRISDDRPGTGLGVARQEKVCADLCRERGWTPLAVFVDNDVSASSGAARPQFDQLMRLLADGSVDTVVVYAVDRLYRRVLELEGLLTLMESRPDVLVTAATGSSLDLASRDGRVMARLLVSLAQREAEMLSFRAASKHAELAAAGKPSGGARAFGYTSDHRQVVEAEAAVIREMAQRLIATRNVSAVTRWLQQAGVKTAREGDWQVQTVRGLLTNPRLLGLRVHKGKVTTAVWPAILDQDVFDELQGSAGLRRAWGLRRPGRSAPPRRPRPTRSRGRPGTPAGPESPILPPRPVPEHPILEPSSPGRR
jgi:site-specific DNA recombinase